MKQQAFSKAYATPGSPSFGNGLQSALQVYDVANNAVAGSIGNENIKKPLVQTYIQLILEQHDLGHEVRANTIREIVRGEQPPTVQVITHPDGTETTTTTYHPVTATARLKAIDLCYRVDGTYARAGAEGEIARKEYSALRKRVERDIGAKSKGKAKAGEKG